METAEPASTTSLTVADIMSGPVRSVRPESSVADLTRLLLTEHFSGTAVVSTEGELVGVVSVTDVIRLLSDARERPAGDPLLTDAPGSGPGGGAPDPQVVLESLFVQPGDRLPPLSVGEDEVSLLEETPVEDIMTSAAFTISGSATIRELADALTRGGVHRLLVVDNGELRGIVTTVDVARAVAARAR